MRNEVENVWLDAKISFRSGVCPTFARVRPNESMPVWCLSRICGKGQTVSGMWNVWMLLPENPADASATFHASVLFPAIDDPASSLPPGTEFVLIRGNAILGSGVIAPDC